MGLYKHYHDTVHWHMSDITSRIIAESGIPSDRFHLGKIILQCLKDRPDDLAQIEGSTGTSEKNSSVQQRSIQCAIALKKLGVQPGDVMMLMAPNHLDLVVPFYAALYLGAITAPIDRFLGISELTDSFKITKPNIVFCQSEKVEDVRKALKELNLRAKIITFDKGEGDENFTDLLKQGDDSKLIAKFRPTDLDPSEAIAMLVATSGSTGSPKHAAVTHKNFTVMGPYMWARTIEVSAFKRSLVVSPIQWLTAIWIYLWTPFMKITRIQSLQNATQEHVYELINKYRPSYMLISPNVMMTLLKPGDREKCDFTCFERITMGGSAVFSNVIEELVKVSPRTEGINNYGMSELAGIAFSHGFSSPPDCCGKPIGCLQYRLVDTETGKDIIEPNVKGELWLKGPAVFKGYYNNPEETKQAFEDGWLKSGDMFYRDENWNFYFVERIKLLLKYFNHQISPVELEGVIRRHSGVLDVAVTGVPDAACGELPVACVVRAPNHNITAQEIKDLVKESLTDTKQLRGGVIFLDQLPLTPNTKVHRSKLRELALTMERD